LVPVSPAGADPERLFVTTWRSGADVRVVDPVTGDRAALDLDDYPIVLTARYGVVSPAGELYLDSSNAAQLRVIIRWDPVSRTWTGITGHVDRLSDTPRGAGPDFQPGIVGMLTGPWGVLYVLREYGGPMQVDLVTGDRTVVSQSVDPPVGTGVTLTQPVDMVVEAGGTLLVAQRFGGLVRIWPSDGRRELLHAFPDLVEAWHRLDRLSDGRIIHAVGRGDGREVSAFDPGLTARAELSGPSRGSGPAFAGIADLAVGPDGRIWVLDSALRAILAVDPSTGDRRIVSGGPSRLGAGPDLPDQAEIPLLARFHHLSQAPAAGRARRNLDRLLP